MSQTPPDGPDKQEGARRRKQRETRRRIADAAMRLFLSDGYEGTTLDAIAAAAGISRRTFFSYFKSKDDILMEWQGDAWEAIRSEVAQASPDQAPVESVRDVLVKHVARYRPDEMMRLDRVLRSSESLRARKQADYERRERELFAVMCGVWSRPERRKGLRLVAMASIGAMRLAVENWSEDGGSRPMADYLREAFANLKAEM